ncbi:type II toxin-antitoxin system Phd/YefM family antitoxin [Nonomuraea sp. SBT364]|uniref:type II toxin-antitoxin system Phd/YefM family antitoxin n=1 Tax=Nonomuraea sp. SBT364 TaxID=1580530 RepID=UPI0018CD012A|nr:type II toxin-antitoxin system Phd/YefM family antitoxin [Nonomuraea sp. SBT364]
MSEDEIGLREGRAKFGDLVNRAEYAGQTTYITRHGRRVAAIVPIDQIAKEQSMETISFTRDNDNPEWGTDTITLTVDGDEVTEAWTVDGISDKSTQRFPGGHADTHVHERRIELVSDGYTEQ